MCHRIANRLRLLFLAVLVSCSTARPECGRIQLSREQVIQIVESEIRNRGGEASPNRKSKVEVKRDGCDYLYHEVYLPKRPGGYLFVRLDRHGTVTVFMPGV